jgi:hypothetical protein
VDGATYGAHSHYYHTDTDWATLYVNSGCIHQELEVPMEGVICTGLTALQQYQTDILL